MENEAHLLDVPWWHSRRWTAEGRGTQVRIAICAPACPRFLLRRRPGWRFGRSLGDEQPAQNWYGQGESDL